MADAILLREGFTTLLDALLDDLVAWVRLYTNDVDPDIDTSKEEFKELKGFGYEPYAIPRWTPAALRGGSAFAVPDIVHFVFPGPDFPPPIIGYYVTAGAKGPAMWAWRAEPGPFVAGPDNTILTVYIEFDFPVPVSE